MADEVKGVEGLLNVEAGNPQGERFTCEPPPLGKLRRKPDGVYAWYFDVTRPGHATVVKNIEGLRALLLSQGLHIVGEADWAVLEAVRKVSDADWKFIHRNGSGPMQWIANNALEASSQREIEARRAAKGE